MSHSTVEPRTEKQPPDSVVVFVCPEGRCQPMSMSVKSTYYLLSVFGPIPVCAAVWTGGAKPLRLFGPVATTRLFPSFDSPGLERAANDLITDAGQIADTTASHEHDRVLL